MYINSFFILIPEQSNKTINEEKFKYDNAIYEINYNSERDISIFITEVNENKICNTKIINILLHRKVYIVLSNVYSEVQKIKNMLKFKFNIDSHIFNNSYDYLIKKYKINNIYITSKQKIIDVKIKNNNEINKYMDSIYSIVFIVNIDNISYVVNIPKFGLFNVGYQSKENLINIVEEMNLING